MKRVSLSWRCVIRTGELFSDLNLLVSNITMKKGAKNNNNNAERYNRVIFNSIAAEGVIAIDFLARSLLEISN